MTLNEFLMFVTGIFWGVFIVSPIWTIVSKVYKNARKAHEDQRRNHT